MYRYNDIQITKYTHGINILERGSVIYDQYWQQNVFFSIANNIVERLTFYILLRYVFICFLTLVQASKNIVDT